MEDNKRQINVHDFNNLRSDQTLYSYERLYGYKEVDIETVATLLMHGVVDFDNLALFVHVEENWEPGRKLILKDIQGAHPDSIFCVQQTDSGKYEVLTASSILDYLKRGYNSSFEGFYEVELRSE